MTTILRPLSISELLDRTFHLYRNNFFVFLGITAIPQLFILPLTLGGAAMMARHQSPAATIMMIAGYLLYWLAVFIAQVPTISAVSDLQLEKPITIAGSYSSSWRSLVRVIWIVFLIFLIVGGIFVATVFTIAFSMRFLTTLDLGPWVNGTTAAVLVVVPGYLTLRWILSWSLAIPATVLEGGWFLASIRRSRFLVKENRWRMFVIYFLMGVLGVATSITVESLLLMLVSLLGITDEQQVAAALQAMQAIGIFVSTTLVGALGTVAICLFYYDQRVRKEGFDLQLMIATLESSSVSAQAAPAPQAG